MELAAHIARSLFQFGVLVPQ